MNTEMVHPNGRPLKWETTEDLQAAIDGYFAQAQEAKEPLTVTGLALALDTTRKTLIEYEDRPDFVNAIKRAKTRIENYAEKRLFEGAATGPIFALKNFNWRDDQNMNVGGQKDNPVRSINATAQVDAETHEELMKYAHKHTKGDAE